MIQEKVSMDEGNMERALPLMGNAVYIPVPSSSCTP